MEAVEVGSEEKESAPRRNPQAARYYVMAEAMGFDVDAIPEWDGIGDPPGMEGEFVSHLEAEDRIFRCQATHLPLANGVILEAYGGQVLVGRGVASKYFDAELPRKSDGNTIKVPAEATIEDIVEMTGVKVVGQEDESDAEPADEPETEEVEEEVEFESEDDDDTLDLDELL